MDSLASLSEMLKAQNIEIPDKKISTDNFLQMQCNWYNETVVSDDGYECGKCRNKGLIAEIADGVMIRRECECMKIRKSLAAIRASGLANWADRCTFERYIANTEWQKKAKDRAVRYCETDSDGWLFFGGQSGVGKTHLCTAVCLDLIYKGRTVKYAMWRDLVHSFESTRYNNEAYFGKLDELKSVDVLYIDDFLKALDKKSQESELNYAYEIINARYVAGKKTIISSERYVSEILNIDAAIGGRIAEKARGNIIEIRRETGRNYRLTGG